MYEHEPELEGDLDWALFPAREQPIGGRKWIASNGTVFLLVAACWYASPVLGVVGSCLAFALQDVRNGRRMAKLIPDKAGARMCSLFSYAWGTWKAGAAAVGLLLLAIFLTRPLANAFETQVLMTAFGSIFFGFLASAGLTAAGLIAALRSGMRVWIGEGMNQARTLLLAMLLATFTCFVLIPWTALLGRFSTRTAVASEIEVGWSSSNVIFVALLTLGMGLFLFAAPIFILIMLDRLCRRVVADRPGKFGPKVPSVGNWNS